PSSLVFNSLRDCYFLCMNTGSPKYINKIAGSSTVTGCVFEDASGAATTSLMVPQGNTITVSRCFSLANPNGNSTGYFVFGQNTGHTVEHCFQYGNATQAKFASFSIGNGVAGVAGEVASYRANIIYASSSNSNTFAIYEGSTTTFTLDTVTVAGYNCFRNA